MPTSERSGIISLQIEKVKESSLSTPMRAAMGIPACQLCRSSECSVALDPRQHLPKCLRLLVLYLGLFVITVHRKAVRHAVVDLDFVLDLVGFHGPSARCKDFVFGKQWIVLDRCNVDRRPYTLEVLLRDHCAVCDRACLQNWYLPGRTLLFVS